MAKKVEIIMRSYEIGDEPNSVVEHRLEARSYDIVPIDPALWVSRQFCDVAAAAASNDDFMQVEVLRDVTHNNP